MTLTMHEDMTFRKGQTIGQNSRAIGYKVHGLPPGEEALIRDYGPESRPQWRLLRTTNGVPSGPTGEYATVLTRWPRCQKEPVEQARSDR